MSKIIALAGCFYFFFSSLLLGAEQEIEYVWIYNQKVYSIKLELSESLNQVYQKMPNKHRSTQKVEDYYEGIMTSEKGDNTMRMVAMKVLEAAMLAKINNPNRQLDFIMAFIQFAIQSDIEKAKKVIQGKDFRYKTPYETLFSQSGLCLEKCLLAIAIIRQTGYWGSCLLYYPEACPKAGHTAVGIACPTSQSLYNSGYCYAETMLPLPIGAMPRVNDDCTISIDGRESVSGNISKLGKVNTLLIMQGRVLYTR